MLLFRLDHTPPAGACEERKNIMRIYERFAEKEVKNIEKMLINTCNGFFELAQDIYNQIQGKNTYERVDPLISNDYIELYYKQFGLLQSIRYLLNAAKDGANEIEESIFQKLIDFLDERLTGIYVLRQVLENPESNCLELREVIEDFFYNYLYCNLKAEDN